MATAGMTLVQRSAWWKSHRSVDGPAEGVPTTFMCAGAPDSHKGHPLTTDEEGEDEVVVDYYKPGHLGSVGMDE